MQLSAKVLGLFPSTTKTKQQKSGSQGHVLKGAEILKNSPDRSRIGGQAG